jgi:DNA polymerase I
MALVFDLETDGLLREVTKVWTLTIYDSETQQYRRYDKEDVAEGIQCLHNSHVIGHNICAYDLLVLEKLYPHIKPSQVEDTIVMARLAFPDLLDKDFRMNSKRLPEDRMPEALIGRHSLKAYGYRLWILKGVYGEEEGAWDAWTQELSDYCEQDVRVTVALYERLKKENLSERALKLEHAVAPILSRQEYHGVCFDIKGAEALVPALRQRQEDLRMELQAVFHPWYRPKPVNKHKEYWQLYPDLRKIITPSLFIPKKDDRNRGYVKGCPLSKIELIEFNPGSRDHITNRLKKLYEWEPEEFTATGLPKVDDDIISALPYPETKPLGEYLMIVKRLGQISDGEQAWLKVVKEDGRIHGGVNPNGAGTGRMTHFKPNVTQVPKVGNPYGVECRGLFYAPAGYSLVGCDAAALELRVLSHFMAPWDGGAYGRASIDGRKEDGTDVHTLNMKAIGAPDRDTGKTWFYAYLYGAGNPKLGKTILKGAAGDYGKVGAKSRAKFKKNLPALKKLQDKIDEKVKSQGFINGIDGRKVPIRSAHSALNFLCQGGGAVLMKQALVIADANLQALGLKCAWNSPSDYDYEFVINAHDEWQVETKQGLEEMVGKVLADAIRKAGEHFNWRIPLAGEYASGRTWADTH